MAEKSLRPSSSLLLAVGATGVVFGDIGTSPLYAFRESFVGEHKLPVDSYHVLGVLSMLLWALILVVTVKYVFLTMRADNHGEGGSFALLSLIRQSVGGARLVAVVTGAALLATALFYGDAVITPAMSVLSAVEGLSLIDEHFTPWIVPLTLAIIVGLFLFQKHGTDTVGKIFGPVMVLWFATIGIIGLIHIVHNPQVLWALNPGRAAGFFLADPARGFLTLGTVVLAITGAEALYADMGHFGRLPIARAWLWLGLPCLMLCYAGQSALVLSRPETIESPFFLMVPHALLPALVVLSSLATVIASQSIISGAFSITQQAIQLGYLPRLRIVYTSEESIGHIYLPFINMLLLIATVCLVLGFRSSAALGAAFGLAVTATMVLTTLMMGVVIFRIWKKSPLKVGIPYLFLLTLDLGLFVSSTTKFRDGGWLPLAIAAVLLLLFDTWKRGRQRLAAWAPAKTCSPAQFLELSRDTQHVPATGIYLSARTDEIPPALMYNLKYNMVVQERVIVVTVKTELVPRVAPDKRLDVMPFGDRFLLVTIHGGFSETLSIPDALRPVIETHGAGFPVAGYFVSRYALVPKGLWHMAVWREHIFAAMVRLAATPMTFFRLPAAHVVEMGEQIEI